MLEMPKKPLRNLTAEKKFGFDDPRVEVRIGLILVVGSVVAFAIWAAITPLDAAAFGPGQISVAGHRETLQHREGGVLKSVNVKEGDHVMAGQVLIELVGADVTANKQALSFQLIGLKAERARLQAEQFGSRGFAQPADFASLPPEERAEARRAMDVQRERMMTRAMSVESRKTVLRQRVEELREQIEGFKRQLESTDEQRRLLVEERISIKSLADQGYAPMSQVRSLERSIADLDGRRGQYIAQIGQSRQQIGEVQSQVAQIDSDQREQIAKELRDAEFQINDVSPKLTAATDQIGRIQLKAPATGTVVALTVFGVGGVIAPGQRLLDVVPDHAPLVIAARFNPNDVDGVHVGKVAEVKLGGEKDRAMPILKGVISRLSADSLVNEKTGQPYFSAEVTVPPDQMAMAYKARGAEAAMRPGLPAQVIVPLAKRTALDYLIEPLTRTLWRGFRER